MTAPRVSFEVPSELLDAIADRAAELVLDRLGERSQGSPYLNVDEAAEYLRCSCPR